MISREYFGIGCDVEEINRFCLDRIKDTGFLKKVFTTSELDYCFSFENPAPHLAACFCAKEARGKSAQLGRKDTCRVWV